MSESYDSVSSMLQHRIQGALVAGAIGDALGWITEFERAPADLQRKYGVMQITDFVAWSKRVGGHFHGYTDEIRAGEYSDDTQLALCTARCITDQGHFDVIRFAKLEFPSWLDYARGAGRTVRKAAQAIQRKKASWHSNFFQYTVRGQQVDYRDGGANGAAMRIAPIALVHPGWTVQAAKDIWANAITSHGHPRAILGALIYGYALNTLPTSTRELEPLSFIETLASFVKSLGIPSDDEHIHTWQDVWNEGRGSRSTFQKVFEDTRMEAIEFLRIVYRAVRNHSSITDVLTRLGCFSPATKGSGLGTVVAGVYFFARTRTHLEQVIVSAVNAIGTDTDSIAAFAGSLAGCLNGVEAIPTRWRNEIQDGSYLMSVGEQLAAIADRRPSVPTDLREHLDAANIEGLSPQLRRDGRVYHQTLGHGYIQTIDRQMTQSGREVVLVRVIFDQGQSAGFAIRDTNKVPLRALVQGKLL